MSDTDFGKRLKTLRTQRDMTLQDVGDKAQLSTSFLSQIETGVTQPSIPSLKRIVNALDTTFGELFEEPGESSVTHHNHQNASVHSPVDGVGPEEGLTTELVRIVRRGARKTLSWPNGASCSLLTPDLRGRLEVLHTTYDPEAEVMGHDYTHEGEELGIVLKGELEVTVDDQPFRLGVGDSIHYPSHLTHWGRAIGTKPAESIWIITPPSF